MAETLNSKSKDLGFKSHRWFPERENVKKKSLKESVGLSLNKLKRAPVSCLSNGCPLDKKPQGERLREREKEREREKIDGRERR